MKTTISFFMVVLVVLACGCHSSSWETELAALYQKGHHLHESFRQGEISKAEYSNAVREVSQSVQKIISTHKEEIFQNQIDDLEEVKISAEIVDFISESLPVEKQTVGSFWSEREPGDDLIRMSPKAMTDIVLTRQLSIEEYKSISLNPNPVHLIEISENACKTVMLSTNTIYTVSFAKGNYCWTPTEYHKYKRK